MKHESRAHGTPDFFYRPQHVDVETFEKNYAAIDWSRKREKTPVEIPGTPCEPAAGWRGVATYARTEGSGQTPEDRIRLEKAFIERTETND